MLCGDRNGFCAFVLVLVLVLVTNKHVRLRQLYLKANVNVWVKQCRNISNLYSTTSTYPSILMLILYFCLRRVSLLMVLTNIIAIYTQPLQFDVHLIMLLQACLSCHKLTYRCADIRFQFDGESSVCARAIEEKKMYSANLTLRFSYAWVCFQMQ
jgi:hypothetical protein